MPPGSPTRKRERAAEPPSTEQASRQRSGSQVPPVTETYAQADAYVCEYLTRFRHGTNLRGGGKQERPDAEILDNLCSFMSCLKRQVGESDCRKLREFLTAYGVVRTFRGVSEDSVLCLKPLVEHLQSRRAALQCHFDLVREVDQVVAACQAAGFNRNISFASKCLCMLGHPAPIYSSEAVAYLKHAGHALKQGATYDEFQRAWFAQYDKEGAPYEMAASKHLASGDGVSSSGGGVDVGELERRLGASWFAMRGFDVKMMVVGAPMRSKK